MASKLNLDVNTIYEKEFVVEERGYNAKAVDEFLDMVIEDYQTFEDTIREMDHKIKQEERTNASLQAQLMDLQAKLKAANDGRATVSASNVDILKRLSRLEQEVFKNK